MLGAFQEELPRRESLGRFRLDYKEAQSMPVGHRSFDAGGLPVGWSHKPALAGKIILPSRQLSVPALA